MASSSSSSSTTWSPEEDASLLALQAEHGNKWTLLASLLGNKPTPAAARSRFAKLEKGRRAGESMLLRPRPKKRPFPEEPGEEKEGENEADSAPPASPPPRPPDGGDASSPALDDPRSYACALPPEEAATLAGAWAWVLDESAVVLRDPRVFGPDLVERAEDLEADLSTTSGGTQPGPPLTAEQRAALERVLRSAAVLRAERERLGDAILWLGALAPPPSS